jgi:hypothetical protein
VPAAPGPKQHGIQRPRGEAAGRWAQLAHKTGKKKHAANPAVEGNGPLADQLLGENRSNRPE